MILFLREREFLFQKATFFRNIKDMARIFTEEGLKKLHAELEEVRQMSDGRPIADWAPWVGAIAGLENYTDAEAVRLFTTGMTPLESPLRPPMPEYRMSTEDAEAVVAYLGRFPA